MPDFSDRLAGSERWSAGFKKIDNFLPSRPQRITVLQNFAAPLARLIGRLRRSFGVEWRTLSQWTDFGA
jgi:hypothetical protein